MHFYSHISIEKEVTRPETVIKLYTIAKAGEYPAFFLVRVVFRGSNGISDQMGFYRGSDLCRPWMSQQTIEEV
jgi:hypothetical protein